MYTNCEPPLYLKPTAALSAATSRIFKSHAEHVRAHLSEAYKPPRVWGMCSDFM